MAREWSAFLLGIVLVSLVLFDAVAGVGTARINSHPGFTEPGMELAGFVFAGMLPVVVVVLAIRSRRQKFGFVSRVLYVEKLSIPIGVAAVGLVTVVAAASVI
jgi:hypothetical protein